MERFGKMMAAVMTSTVTVLERQYKKYLAIDITELLAKETRSACSHSIDTEEVMAMLSALKKKNPDATICFLASKMMAVKNRTVDYMDNMTTEHRETSSSLRSRRDIDKGSRSAPSSLYCVLR